MHIIEAKRKITGKDSNTLNKNKKLQPGTKEKMSPGSVWNWQVNIHMRMGKTRASGSIHEEATWEPMIL